MRKNSNLAFNQSRWSVRQLGSVCTVIAGQSPKSAGYNDVGEGLPFYQGKKQFTDRYLSAPTTWTTEVTKIAEPKDILMSVRAPVGPINESTETICIGRGLAAIRAGSDVDREFLWYALLWLQPTITGNAGAVFSSINKKSIESLEIPIPTLNEQKRIVATLNQAFSALDCARSNAEENLAQSQLLRESIVTSKLDQAAAAKSEKVKLGQLCNIARGGSPRPIKRYLTTESGGVNWIKIADATASGQYIERTKQKISAEGVAHSRYVKPGAFLLTNSMSFGRPYILRTDGCIHDGWLVLEPDYSRVNQDYLYFLLGSQQVFRQFDRLAAGSTVRNLNIGLVSNVIVDLPDKDLQLETVKSISKIFSRCSSLENDYRCQLDDIDELRQSLLQEAFAGELS